MASASVFPITTHPCHLTSDQVLLLKGLVAQYQHMMLLDLRNGRVADVVANEYKRSLAEADEVMNKLKGVTI